jgi:uncharacterized protein (DUF58 family)
VRQWWDSLRGLTVRGRCLLASGLALGGCAFLLGQRDLLRVAVLLVVLPLAAVAVVVRTRYRLMCSRRLDPPRVEVGRTATVRLHLENVSRMPSGVLLMEDALAWTLGARPRFVLDRVEPKGVRDVSYPVSAEVRGRFVVGPLAVQLTDPFGLCELRRSFAATDTLVVTPVVTPLPPVRLGGDGSAGGDAVARSVAASGTDDVSTREYRQGDDLRKVHWRSTARTGELMVRREEQPFQSRATLLLDARSCAHRGDGPGSSFEQAVSATASIGVALARTGYSLQLLAEGQAGAPPGLALAEGMLLDALSGVQPTRARSLEPVLDRLRRGTGAGVLVAVLGALDLDEADALARSRAGGATGVAVLLDTDSWAAGARARDTADGSAAQVRALLAGAGWRVVPVGSGTSLASVWPLAGGRGAATPAPATAPAPAPAPAPARPSPGARPLAGARP